jgi:hypothetical protein
VVSLGRPTCILVMEIVDRAIRGSTVIKVLSSADVRQYWIFCMFG